mmetsp:Transcript_48037/g.88466  ORF Transcript_48037/g.88466 Transcript_48037/m.88466 type:complete len:498 (-) Transcript_48037:72-1565(-)
MASRRAGGSHSHSRSRSRDSTGTPVYAAVFSGEPRSQSSDRRELQATTLPAADDETEEAVEKREARIAAARLAGLLLSGGQLKIEAGSVYGAAVLMPQIARGGGWSGALTTLALQSYFFLLLNIVLQTMTNYMIAQEEKVFDLFAGQMYLCDFGANLPSCPEGPGCEGPGGTSYSPPRVYEFDTWSTRVYVREALRQLFPDRVEEVDKFADPGEYGLESLWCRYLCCLIFMLSVVEELLSCLNMAHMLWAIPTKNEMWIGFKDSGGAVACESMDPESFTSSGMEGKANKVQDSDWHEQWLDTIKIKVAGMSLFWKVVTALLVWLPKVLLWKITVQSGITMLMETSSIENLIVNSVALTYVLSIDEMICSSLMPDACHTILEKCENFELFDVDTKLKELESDETMLDAYGGRHRCSILLSVIPVKFIVVLLLCWLFIWDYFSMHCERDADGRWVSKSMYRPRSLTYGLWNLVFPNFAAVPSEDTPFWEMPQHPHETEI